jgi:hypothetical protein
MAGRQPFPLKPSFTTRPVSINGNRLPTKSKPKKPNPWQKLLEDRSQIKEVCKPSLHKNHENKLNRTDIKIMPIKHPRVNPDINVKSVDEEEIELSEICQRIKDLPDLVKAELMKCQRIAENNKPSRQKINGELRTAIALQSMVLEGEQTIPLYPSFILFLKHYFGSEYSGPRTQLKMTTRLIEIMSWMYHLDRHLFQFDRHLIGQPNNYARRYIPPNYRYHFLL